MKKSLSVIITVAVLAAGSTAFALKPKADVKTETTSFSVSSDRSRAPSAYCRRSDGSPVGSEYSTSDNFCICGSAMGNASILTYDGLPAYCIGDHIQNSPVSLMQVTKLTDIPYDSEDYGAVFRMASGGASTGTTYYGLNETDLYYVTQCAIRTWLYDMEPDSLAFFDADGNYHEGMSEEFRRIYNTAYDEPDPECTGIITDDSGAETKTVYYGDKCFFRYGPFVPYAENADIEYYEINYSSDDAEAVITPFGDLINLNSENRYNAETPFYVYLNAAYSGELELEITSEIHTEKYSPVVYLSSDDRYQDIFQIQMTDFNEELFGYYSLSNSDNTGSIKLNKRFLAGEADICDSSLISQPRFTVKNSDGKYISGIQCDGVVIFDHFSDTPVEYALTENSDICISGLPLGEYTAYEVKGAEGYEALECEIPVNNTYATDICNFVNVSVTTTAATTPEVTTTTEEVTTAVTTAETTTETVSETPVTETTEDVTTDSTTVTTVTTTVSTSVTGTETTFEEITLTLPTEVTYMSEITETHETEKVTTSETENTSETHQVSRKQRSDSRISATPKTGESGFPAAAVLVLMAFSAAAVIVTGKLR